MEPDLPKLSPKTQEALDAFQGNDSFNIGIYRIPNKHFSPDTSDKPLKKRKLEFTEQLSGRLEQLHKDTKETLQSFVMQNAISSLVN